MGIPAKKPLEFFLCIHGQKSLIIENKIHFVEKRPEQVLGIGLSRRRAALCKLSTPGPSHPQWDTVRAHSGKENDVARPSGSASCLMRNEAVGPSL